MRVVFVNSASVRPGRADAEVTVLVTEVAAVDIARNTVTLRGAEGSLRTINVKNPDNQRKLQTLKVGDLVQFDVIEAVAVVSSRRPKSARRPRGSAYL